jgi:hypothetical protein
MNPPRGYVPLELLQWISTWPNPTTEPNLATRHGRTVRVRRLLNVPLSLIPVGIGFIGARECSRTRPADFGLPSRSIRNLGIAIIPVEKDRDGIIFSFRDGVEAEQIVPS